MEVQRIKLSRTSAAGPSTGEHSKSRRNGLDRRRNTAVHAGTERRSGIERRNLDEKLRHMLQQSKKEKAAREQPRIRSGDGNVIRRRSGQREKRISS